MIADMTAAFLMSAADLVLPMFTRTVINDIVPSGNFRMLLIYGAILLGIYTAKVGCNYFMQFWGHIVGVRMQADMRKDIFTHMQRLPFAFFDENKSGALMSRIVNDLQDAAELAHHGPEYFFLSIVTMTGAFVLLCTINLTLTLIIFAFLPFFVFVMVKMQKRMEKGFTESRKRTEEINAELQNSLAGIRVAKAFDNEDVEIRKFDATLVHYKGARVLAYRAMATFYSFMFYFIDLMYLVVLVAGGVFFFQQRIDIGDFFAYFIFIGQFINPIRRLMQFFEMYEDGKTGFKRFCEIMDTEPEKERSTAREEENLAGDIVFDQVTFTYGNDQNVLDKLNMTIKNGSTLALVGPSGGGKTTLCHLLPRFYDIESGAITIGGRDIRDITRGSLRRGMGIVQQEVFLFTGTIADNIGYSCPDATRQQIIDAAKKANIHTFIETMEEGYDTFVGERGIKLSGGQKQRIAIARIFLKDPQILILDEATSALDNVTEHQLQQSIEELSKGRTTIIVAHRLSTVRGADEIVVLSDDGVAEQGTHQQLIDQKGIYYQLYNSQFT